MSELEQQEVSNEVEIEQEPAEQIQNAASLEAPGLDEVSEQETPQEETKEENLDSTTFEPEQAARFVKSLDLPSEVEPFLDPKDKTLKFVIPIDGKRYVQSLGEVVKGFGLQQASYRKLDEAKNILSSNRKFHDKIKEDPKKYWELADTLGLDKRKLAYDMLSEVVQEEEMTAEERYKREAEQSRKEKEELEQRIKQEKEQKEYSTLRDKEVDRLNNEFKEALPELGFKEYSPRSKMSVVGTAIEKMKFFTSMGKNISIKDAVFMAKQEKMSLIQDYLGELDDKRLMDTIPKAIIERLRSIDVAKIQSGKSVIPTSATGIGSRVDLKEIEQSKANTTTKKRGNPKQSVSDYINNL